MLFNNFKNNYRRWRAYRRTVEELSMLNDRELADIGVSRWDINTVARGDKR